MRMRRLLSIRFTDKTRLGYFAQRPAFLAALGLGGNQRALRINSRLKSAAYI